MWKFYDLAIETGGQMDGESEIAANGVDVLEEGRDEDSGLDAGDGVKALSGKTGNDFDFSKSRLHKNNFALIFIFAFVL